MEQIIGRKTDGSEGRGQRKGIGALEVSKARFASKFGFARIALAGTAVRDYNARPKFNTSVGGSDHEIARRLSLSCR